MASAKSKILSKNLGKIHKNREKNLQFYSVKESKIRWSVLEIKFIKGKNFLKIWQVQNQKFGLKIRNLALKIWKDT